MFIMFVTQLGTQGLGWVIWYNPKPSLGPRFGPKTQPKVGLGWVGSGSNWVLEKSIYIELGWELGFDWVIRVFAGLLLGYWVRPIYYKLNRRIG
jgi:hypothetical protein